VSSLHSAPDGQRFAPPPPLPISPRRTCIQSTMSGQYKADRNDCKHCASTANGTSTGHSPEVLPVSWCMPMKMVQGYCTTDRFSAAGRVLTCQSMLCSELFCSQICFRSSYHPRDLLLDRGVWCGTGGGQGDRDGTFTRNVGIRDFSASRTAHRTFCCRPVKVSLEHEPGPRKHARNARCGRVGSLGS
jgi:hypothetical protein